MFSCRVIRVEGLDRYEETMSRSGGRGVYTTWHQRMSFLFYFFRSTHATAMISRSRDGEYIARIVAWLGIKSVRGSSTRGGLGALRELVKKINEGENGGMLADGPQGPARVAKLGAMIIARDSGVPLIPILFGGDRCWIFNSWDRYMVPKPFARVVVFYGEPVWVPRTAKREELEEYRRLLEERLNRGARWCDEQFGPERPWRKITEQGMPEIGPL